jgi:hypothetical protein
VAAVSTIQNVGCQTAEIAADLLNACLTNGRIGDGFDGRIRMDRGITVSLHHAALLLAAGLSGNSAAANVTTYSVYAAFEHTVEHAEDEGSREKSSHVDYFAGSCSSAPSGEASCDIVSLELMPCDPLVSVQKDSNGEKKASRLDRSSWTMLPHVLRIKSAVVRKTGELHILTIDWSRRNESATTVAEYIAGDLLNVGGGKWQRTALTRISVSDTNKQRSASRDVKTAISHRWTPLSPNTPLGDRQIHLYDAGCPLYLPTIGDQVP